VDVADIPRDLLLSGLTDYQVARHLEHRPSERQRLRSEVRAARLALLPVLAAELAEAETRDGLRVRRMERLREERDAAGFKVKRLAERLEKTEYALEAARGALAPLQRSRVLGWLVRVLG
jgi:hypothetical protein